MIAEGSNESGIPPGNACYSPWVDPKSYVALDLKKLKTGLVPYTMPAYQVEKGKKEKLGCTPGLIE